MIKNSSFFKKTLLTIKYLIIKWLKLEKQEINSRLYFLEKQNVKLSKRTKSARGTIKGLLNRYTYKCDFDRAGNCTAHKFYYGNGECPVGNAVKWLKQKEYDNGKEN